MFPRHPLTAILPRGCGLYERDAMPSAHGGGDAALALVVARTQSFPNENDGGKKRGRPKGSKSRAGSGTLTTGRKGHRRKKRAVASGGGDMYSSPAWSTPGMSHESLKLLRASGLFANDCVERAFALGDAEVRLEFERLTRAREEYASAISSNNRNK
tara:strand:+ start:815 stop:1285 length:471 start_codon:yes stop_codon:yes gene_type:complete